MDKYEKYGLSFRNKSMEDIKEFVENAEMVEGTVLVSSGRNCFDGRSFMSMINLKDCDILLVMYPRNSEYFRKYLVNKFPFPRLRENVFSYI